jgi:hypothetical protein
MDEVQAYHLIKTLKTIRNIGAMILIALITLPFLINRCHASDWKIETLKFGTGIITAYALHETGHAAAAWVTGTDMEWNTNTYNQPLGFTEHAEHNGSGMFVHSAGLLTQVGSSEIILQSEIDKNDSFVRGMMAWNVINPIVYSLDYWFLRKSNKEDGRHYQGDIQGIEHYSNDATANGYAAAMTGMALWQGWRFLKTQRWAPEWVKSDVARVDFRSVGDGASVSLKIGF